MIEHTLSRADQRWASEVGAARVALAKGNPRFAYQTSRRSGLDTHVIGAMAELAFARVVGVEWPASVNTYRTQPDVPPSWEVRWSSIRNRVKVAVDDPPEYLVVHVIGEPPAFQIVGYIIAGWVQANAPRIDPGNRGWEAHFVDTYRLAPIDDRFHLTCAWARRDGEWQCVLCGNKNIQTVRSQ